MTRKEQEITELFLETIQKISKSKENWLSFLQRTAYNYKYRFDEQVLIYAQKPDATAVAETKDWNKKLKRWVNPKTKGIALLTEKEGKLGLRFVFDVSDTNSNYYGRKFKLWSAEEKYHNDIIETLEDKFGTIESKENLPFAIMSTVFNYVTENIQDYLEQLESVTENSELANIDNDKLEAIFLELLIYSTITITLSRCGMKAEDYIRIDDLKDITKFNTFETMTILGTATRDFSREIILEISKVVRNLEKQEKNKIYTFDKNKQQVYDKIINNTKGSVNNEYNLQRGEQLSNTKSNNTTEQKRESEVGQIRTNEAQISKGEQNRVIRNSTNEERIERPLDSNRQNSEKENTNNSRTDETTRESNGRIESNKSNGMGRHNEQYSSNSRTDSNNGANLQLDINQFAKILDKFFIDYDIFDTEDDNRTDEERIKDIENSLKNTEEISSIIKYLKEVKNAEEGNVELNTEIDYYINELKQLYEKIDKEADNASFFNEETIKGIIENAPNVLKNKVQFGEFFYDNHDNKEKCKEYIKEILGNAYTEFEFDGKRVGYKVNNDNLNLWVGNYLNRTEECFKDWNLITDYCISNHFHYSIPEYNKDVYSFIVGDTIYLGLQEFTVLNVDNGKMTIYDNQFPLDQRTVIIKDIIDDIAINPLNDYLKNRELPEVTKQENAFNKWLDNFIEEKGIDLNEVIEVKTENNTHYFEVGNVVENIKATSQQEQAKIKDMIVKIDFYNGDILDYFKHLAQALAKNYEKGIEQTKEKEEQTENNINKDQENIAQKIVKRNKNIEYYDLHPEIPTEERNNYKIRDDKLGVGTLKEKFRNNIEAIKVLKLCEKENRYATPEEQEILARYVGWGGLKSAFEESNDSWSNEYLELKELLTDDEYKNARASSVTAYYTPPVVIRNIYKALQNMGLKQANILEPACRSR